MAGGSRAEGAVLSARDGTIGFHLAEFETAVRASCRFGDPRHDALWNAESQIQLREYGRTACMERLDAGGYDLVVGVAAMGDTSSAPPIPRRD